jgi:hypothetical protein
MDKFDSIKSIEQCAKAFELMAKEIEVLEQAIEQGIPSFFYTDLLREANSKDKDYDDIFKEYKKASEKILKQSDRVALIKKMISRFLSTEEIWANEQQILGRQINITECVRKVTSCTRFVEDVLKDYNKEKLITYPSLKLWVSVYKGSVENFNNIVVRWNRIFHTTFERAEIPRVVESYKKVIKTPRQRNRQHPFRNRR